MNFATIEASATDGQQALLSFMASDWTARNNIIDLQGVRISGGELAICDHRAGFESNVRGSCLNNTVYMDDNTSDRLVLFRGCGIGGGNVAKGNLLYVPGVSGSKSLASGCESQDNLYANSNPFSASPPQQGQTSPGDFKIRNDASVVNAASYTDETQHYVMNDAFRGCRTRSSAAAWDIGAHQFNADSCGAGTIVNNPDPPPVDPPAKPTPPAAPVLLQ